VCQISVQKVILGLSLRNYGPTAAKYVGSQVLIFQRSSKIITSSAGTCLNAFRVNRVLMLKEIGP